MFDLYAEQMLRNAPLDELKAGIKIGRRNSNNLMYVGATTLKAESEEELKSLLMKVKEESERAGLKYKKKTTKIMASGPTTSWQIEGEKVEVVIDFLFLGSKITKVVTASMKSEDICFLDMINLESVLKSRDITLPIKICIIKAMVISVVMYDCESWIIKKAER